MFRLARRLSPAGLNASQLATNSADAPIDVPSGKFTKPATLAAPAPAPAPASPPADIGAARSARFDTFNLNLVVNNLHALQEATGENAEHQRRTLRRLATRAEWHRAVPAADWRMQIAALQAQFPNFGEAIERVVLPHLALVAAGAVRARMSPIILVGPPGVGKTYFARHLTRVLNTSSLQIDMSSATTNAALVGVSTFWANAAPGQLLALLGWGYAGQKPFADPVVVLDEIDKVNADRYDPLGPLYELLEPETASRFEDQSLPGTPFNASMVRWVLTANDLERVPQPIRSRTVVCHVTAPTRDQMRSVVRRIMARTVTSLAIQFEIDLPSAVLDLAAEVSPREAALHLEIAIGRAVTDGRRCLLAEDWGFVPTGPRRALMGFIAS